MRIAYYYKTQRPDIPKAAQADKMTVARVEAQAERFAKLFGARPLFTSGYGSHFAGITFDQQHPCYHPDLWTKITPEYPCTLPRSPEKSGAKNRAKAEMLYKQFYDEWPKDAAEARASQLYTTLGVTVEQLEHQVLIYEEVAGWSYLLSTLPLHLITSDLVEITGSEIEAVVHPAPVFQPVSEEEALAAIAAQREQA